MELDYKLKYEKAIKDHIDGATDIFKSKYRGDEVFVHFNKKTGVGTYTDMNGNYVGGWKFNQKQIDFHIQNGVKIK